MVLSKFWWVIQHYEMGFAQYTLHCSATAAKKRRYWRWNRWNWSSSSSKRSTWKHYEGTDMNVLEKMFLYEFEYKLCCITLKKRRLIDLFLYKVEKISWLIFSFLMLCSITYARIHSRKFFLSANSLQA